MFREKSALYRPYMYVCMYIYIYMVGTSNLGSWHGHWCLDSRQSSFEASVDSRHFLVEPRLGFRPSGGHRFLKQTFCECYYPLPPLPWIRESHFTSVIMKMNNCFHSFCILCLFRVVKLVHGGGWMSNLVSFDIVKITENPACPHPIEEASLCAFQLWLVGCFSRDSLYYQGPYDPMVTWFVSKVRVHQFHQAFIWVCLEAGISPKLSSLPSCFPYFNGPFWGV